MFTQTYNCFWWIHVQNHPLKVVNLFNKTFSRKSSERGHRCRCNDGAASLKRSHGGQGAFVVLEEEHRQVVDQYEAYQSETYKII